MLLNNKDSHSISYQQLIMIVYNLGSWVVLQDLVFPQFWISSPLNSLLKDGDLPALGGVTVSSCSFYLTVFQISSGPLHWLFYQTGVLPYFHVAQPLCSHLSQDVTSSERLFSSCPTEGSALHGHFQPITLVLCSSQHHRHRFPMQVPWVQELCFAHPRIQNSYLQNDFTICSG